MELPRLGNVIRKRVRVLYVRTYAFEVASHAPSAFSAMIRIHLRTFTNDLHCSCSGSSARLPFVLHHPASLSHPPQQCILYGRVPPPQSYSLWHSSGISETEWEERKKSGDTRLSEAGRSERKCLWCLTSLTSFSFSCPLSIMVHGGLENKRSPSRKLQRRVERRMKKARKWVYKREKEREVM